MNVCTKKNANERSSAKKFQALLDNLLDLVFSPPDDCVVCGARKSTDQICPPCIAHLRRPLRDLSEVCAICNRPWHKGGACYECAYCLRAYERVFAGALFTEPVRSLIHQMKYQGISHLARPLSRLIIDAVPHDAHDVLVPVPSHPSRLAERQYNPAALLAAKASRALRMRFVAALKKTSPLPSRFTLDREQRLQSIEGAFRPVESRRKAVLGARVLLVDDVFTTGATAHACASVLLSMGAARVDIAVAAAAMLRTRETLP